jgi:hypothetical protein
MNPFSHLFVLCLFSNTAHAFLSNTIPFNLFLFRNIFSCKKLSTEKHGKPTRKYQLASCVNGNDLPKSQNVKSEQLQILSEDPLIFLVPNLLTAEECRSYQDYVKGRSMTRSNPPAVSLDIAKLWPLPWLSLSAGIPQLLKLIDEKQRDGTNLDAFMVAKTVVPNIGLALAGMIALAWFVVLPIVRAISNASSRTSVAIALNQEYDIEFIRPLVERACAAGGDFPWNHWEAPVVTRYDPGAIFSRHGDASPTFGSEWKDSGGQRIITCICYLNTLSEQEGGATYFDQLNLAVKPEAGTALFFFPADATTAKADDRTTHESLPPRKEKWIVQLFGRIDRVPPPLGLPTSFDAETSYSKMEV